MVVLCRNAESPEPYMRIDSSISENGLGLGTGGPSLRQRAASWMGGLFPVLRWLPMYDWRVSLAPDVAGGVVIGCVLMAQSVAHAQLSGVTLIHGPYSCMVPPIVYMIFGSSHHGSVGTGGLIALITGVELERYATEEERTQAAMVLSLLVGLILVFMGALRLAGLARFMSRPALSGFVTGSALLIVASQLPGALGVPNQHFLALVRHVATGEQRVQPWTVALSFCVVAILDGMQRLKKAWKRFGKLAEFKEIIAMVVSTAFCAAAGADLGIAIVGAMPAGLPGFRLPLPHEPLERAKELLPGAVLLAVMIFVSSFAAAKQIAMKAGYQIDAASELRGLGFANAVGACFGAIPVQIGLSRTGIAYNSGARSQVGVSLVVASVVALALAVLTPLFFYMPRCVLNCIIIVAAKSLCDFQQPLWLYKLSRERRDLKDLLVWVTAFLVTLTWGASKGMFCAMAVSLVLLLLEVTEPTLAVLSCEPEAGGKWRSSNNMLHDDDAQGVLVVRVHGALFYANAERFQEQLEGLELERKRRGRTVHSVVLDFSCIPFMDATVIEVLREMIATWRERGTALRIANAVGRTRKIFENELADGFSQRSFRIDVQEAHGELLALRQASRSSASLQGLGGEC